MMNDRFPTPDDIAAAGRLIYGERWQASLAQALGVSDRTLRYWMAGDATPGDAQMRTLLALIERTSTEAGRHAVRWRQRVAAGASVDDWKFLPEEIRVVDDDTVMHLPTGTKISFYKYPEPPPPEWTPGGTITHVRLGSGEELQRFQRAAWTALVKRRYG